jgi:hypothetical protein
MDVTFADAIQVLSSGVILGVGLLLMAVVASWVSDSITDHLSKHDKDEDR